VGDREKKNESHKRPGRGITCKKKKIVRPPKVGRPVGPRPMRTDDDSMMDRYERRFRFVLVLLPVSFRCDPHHRSCRQGVREGGGGYFVTTISLARSLVVEYANARERFMPFPTGQRPFFSSHTPGELLISSLHEKKGNTRVIIINHHAFPIIITQQRIHHKKPVVRISHLKTNTIDHLTSPHDDGYAVQSAAGPATLLLYNHIVFFVRFFVLLGCSFESSYSHHEPTYYSARP
jgi:hypothetical protein